MKSKLEKMADESHLKWSRKINEKDLKAQGLTDVEIENYIESCGRVCYTDGYLAGAEAFEKQLLEVGVDGAKKGYVTVNKDASSGLTHIILWEKYDSKEQFEFIEALPTLALISKLKSENETLKADIEEISEDYKTIFNEKGGLLGHNLRLTTENIALKQSVSEFLNTIKHAGNDVVAGLGLYTLDANKWNDVEIITKKKG